MIAKFILRTEELTTICTTVARLLLYLKGAISTKYLYEISLSVENNSRTEKERKPRGDTTSLEEYKNES